MEYCRSVGRLGFSLQVEREAMIVDRTIRIEAPDPRESLSPRPLAPEYRKLPSYGAIAARDMIKRLYTPY